MHQTLLSHPQEVGGILGIHGHSDAAKLTCFGLYALQHRGQKGCGIVVSDGKETRQQKGLGLVPEFFTDKALQDLTGHVSLGHVWSSIGEASSVANLQPFTAYHRGRTISVANNGNLINLNPLREKLQQEGAIFHSSVQSEVIVHLLARCGEADLQSALMSVFTKIEGAYSMMMLVDDKLIAVRDARGFRPLCLGTLGDGGYVVASETCAFGLIEAKCVRDVEPGEVLVIDSEGLHSTHLPGDGDPAFCLFEQVYFARPDSNVFASNIYQCRKQMGVTLAGECGIEADLVMPFPDSGAYAAIGYSRASGIPFDMGITRNHYIGRTLVHPLQSMGEFSLRVKLNPIRSLIKGKRVILMEDSVISGATVRSMVRKLREAGAREVHLLVSCPPVRFHCFYGMHFPSRSMLLAHGKSVAEIREHLGLDTLHYLSLDGLLKAVGDKPGSHCTACFDGLYPLNHDVRAEFRALSMNLD